MPPFGFVLRTAFEPLEATERPAEETAHPVGDVVFQR
jgi:hypothetical protein